MQKKTNTLPIFVLLFLLASLLFFLSQKNIFLGLGFIGNIAFPVEDVVFKSATLPQHIQDAKVVQKQEQVLVQEQKIVDYNSLRQDNAAFRDQFAAAQIQSKDLLPAAVIGAPVFVPGVSKPESIVIDQGSTSGVAVGQTVVYKNNVLGQVKEVRDHAALVRLVSSNGVSFPAKTSATNAIGVLRGSGNNTMVLDNVVLSDELRVGDMVVTALGENITSKGYPPGLIIGKIVSVEKNPSSLFQRASVIGLVDVTKISLVFVVKGIK